MYTTETRPLKFRTRLIPGYEVDTEGNIWCLTNGYQGIVDRELIYANWSKNIFVKITIDNADVLLRLDMLVVSSWKSFPDDTIHIVHIDGDKSNCRPDNLLVISKRDIEEKYKNLYHVNELSEIPEEWKIFPRDTNIEVSNFGSIRHSETKEPIQYYYNHGYLETQTGGHKYFLHRLVAELFVENPCPEKYNMVNHIDGQKDNNRFYNLEWCNASMNREHAIFADLSTSYTDEQIHQVCSLLEKGIPQKDISLITGVTRKHISDIFRGRRRKDISEKYNIPKRVFNSEKFHRDQIINYIENKIPPKQIASLLETEYNQTFISYYERVRREWLKEKVNNIKNQAS